MLRYVLSKLFSIGVFASLLANFAVAADTTGLDSKLRDTEPLDTKLIVWNDLTLRDPSGEVIEPGMGNWTVVCFLGTECPLAKLYGARLQRLADEYESAGVSFIGVNSNTQDSPSDIARYAKDYKVKFPIAKDADQSIVKAFDATRITEVFVVDPVGAIRYQGRIDDQYQPGIAKAEPSQHDLRDAIEALVSGKNVSQPLTEAVGCLITRVPDRKPTMEESPGQSLVTFNRDIAPILNEHCVECHRPGEIGPFELSDYNEIVGWGEMMLEVIDQKRMPPWHADPNVGHFVGERRMPSEARDLIARWIDAGMPEGDPADLPPTPEWNDGWHLPTSPDVELVMRGRPFVVPSEGVIEYQYYVVDPGWDEDKWISAAQVVPGDAAVVHHGIVFVRPPDGSDSNGIGWLGAYVPGQRTLPMPTGHARRIPAGSKLVFQMHYTPNGKQTPDTTSVGVWFADPEEVTHEVYTNLAVNHEFEIPPNAKDHVVRMQADSFPPNSRLMGATPHMHLRGRSFEMTAVPKAGEPRALLRVPHYDFNWQHWYAFAEPIELNKIESLDMSVMFDNSGRNPTNPNPQEYVTWGDQTWEEMAIAFFDIAIPRGGPRRSVKKKTPPSAEEVTQREKQIEAAVDKFLSEMDADGDGIVQRDETPVVFQRFGFKKIDRNGDSILDRDEIRRSAIARL
ncbi:redoxin domain-containing protein [Neorhodopirellula pilleata]|uniref:Thiol-disulfide oxidoreductase n=1 Tax=Neorhodopirellula pilleata TaxID=2714738 RepID=A0A5C6A8L9_9BACT|nr:redoxin domain-containing protein [Neorhodopirellula pilleata]TWT95648.1 thiol-disulfide oxidoreductase [Neorhodopirellula pilleata]